MTCPSDFLPTEADDLDSVARLYLRLADHKRELGNVEQELIDVLHVLAGGKKEWEVDGHVVATTFRPISPKTDGEGLLRVVVARARDRAKVDLETGEILVSEGEAVAQTLAEVYPITTGSVKPRRQALRALRIDPDEYTETQGFTRTVRLT